jgi:ABC-type sugar transport system ATPase subunit
MTLLAVRDLRRTFGETVALSGAALTVAPGRVHAIIGENGSGKSSFVKIVSGILAPDAGEIVVDGSRLDRIASPKAARALGIGTVFQEVLVLEERSLLENLWLGHDGPFRHRSTVREKEEAATAVLRELTDAVPPLGTPMKAIDLGLRQLCVIARALLQRPRLLILDEATAALDIAARDRLFDAVRRRCRDGMAVLFITHKMDEIQALADEVTVFRSGESVATLAAAEASPARLLQLMSGRRTEAAAGRAARPMGPALVEVARLVLKADAEPIDLTVRAGEILGLAGLEGQGQDPFARTLGGLLPAHGAIRLAGGRALGARSDFSRAGIAYVPRDRKREGIFAPLSIQDNFAVSTLRRLARMGLLDSGRMQAARTRHLDPLRVKFGRLGDPIATLSGGNQQKVVIARNLALEPRVLVLNDPTRGVDLATKQDIYALLRDLAEKGAAIVLLSTELEELLALADRIAVFRDHALFALLDRRAADREGVIAAMFGQAAGQAAA